MNSTATEQPKTVADLDMEIARLARDCYADPLRWGQVAFPWGKPGLLAKLTGPCPCQQKVLSIIGDEVRARRFNGRDAVRAIRIAVSSGHGIGKSVLFGIIDNWIKSTRPHSQGTVTANTFAQLETKTWATIQAMAKLSLTAHWFEIGASRIYRKGSKETWFSSPQTSSEENSESFAGQHAAGSTSYYLNDECSAIADIIFEVQEGGLTDGEPMQLLFGNPTRSQGKFFRATYGNERDKYKHVIIDSRECPLTNKEQIQEWIDEYGEESDFVRVRVRGLPPQASDAQFIGLDLVHAAQKRQVAVLAADPLVVGVDLAWGGDDFNTIRFRRGSDARSIPAVRIPGEQTRTPDRMVMVLADILSKAYEGRKVSALFMDSAGIAGPVARRLREMGHRNVFEINFGAHSPDLKHANMRSFMWGAVKAAMPTLAIDKHVGLEEDLTAPGYKLDRQTKVLLEPKDQIKERIGHSTDDGDALALTFAAPVMAPVAETREPQFERRTAWG